MPSIDNGSNDKSKLQKFLTGLREWVQTTVLLVTLVASAIWYMRGQAEKLDVLVTSVQTLQEKGSDPTISLISQVIQLNATVSTSLQNIDRRLTRLEDIHYMTPVEKPKSN